MAGSYHHIAGLPKPQSPHEGHWSLIENMGDATEAVDQLLWLVFTLALLAYKTTDLTTAKTIIEANLNDRYYPMVRGELDKDAAFIEVQRLMT